MYWTRLSRLFGSLQPNICHHGNYIHYLYVSCMDKLLRFDIRYLEDIRCWHFLVMAILCIFNYRRTLARELKPISEQHKFIGQII